MLLGLRTQIRLTHLHDLNPYTDYEININLYLLMTFNYALIDGCAS